MLRSVVLHTVAVAMALGVAWVLAKLLGIESPIVSSVLALVVVALEKLVRAWDKIPVGDFVNEK